MAQSTYTGLAAPEVGRQLAEYISPQHLSAETFAGLGEWLAASPARPQVYRNFLRPEVAEAVAAAMRALPVWSRCATAYQSTLATQEIDEREWAARADRAACHYVARPLLDALETGAMDADHQEALKRFLSFAVIAGTLRTWISAGVGFQLERRTSIELACYHAGDEIRPHQDLFPGRVLAVNFYLDRDYLPGTGGELGFRNGAGAEFAVEPLFNTFSLIPIRPDCHHWVTPFTGTGIGRYTVSIGQHRA